MDRTKIYGEIKDDSLCKVTKMIVIWAPPNCGVTENELADCLAANVISFPVDIHQQQSIPVETVKTLAKFTQRTTLTSFNEQNIHVGEKIISG